MAAGQHIWVIGFGRWIINFLISSFCLTAATLPQRKRRSPGCAACAAKAAVIPLELGMVWVVGLRLVCPRVCEPGAVPWSAHGCNPWLLAGKSANLVVSSQVKDVTTLQAAPGWFAAAVCHEQVRGQGRARCSFACPGERWKVVLLFFLFFSSREVTLCYKWKGRRAVLCLCPPWRHVCRKDRSYTLQSMMCWSHAARGLCSAPWPLKGPSPTPFVSHWGLDTEQDMYNLCFPVSLSCCDSESADVIFLRLEFFFSWHEFTLLFAVAVAVRLWPLLRAESSISPQFINQRNFI